MQVHFQVRFVYRHRIKGQGHRRKKSHTHSVTDVALSRCRSQSTAHLCEQFLHVQQIGFVTWDPYAMHRVTMHACCIIVTWWSVAAGIRALSARPIGCLQCFDTVGLVI